MALTASRQEKCLPIINEFQTNSEITGEVQHFYAKEVWKRNLHY